MWIICHQAFEGVTFPSRDDALIMCRAHGLGPWRITVNFEK